MRYVSVKKTLFIAILAVTAFFAFSIVIENKFYRTSKCNVIMYHLIDDDAPTEGEYLYVRPSEFDFQLSCIGKMGVETNRRQKGVLPLRWTTDIKTIILKCFPYLKSTV